MPVVENHLFFFFKQKTAYEMRISDWSSDVCSSDVPALLAVLVWAPQLRSHTNLDMPRAGAGPRLYRSWLAWQVPLSMGFQSAVAYCVFGWLPLILIERGLSAMAAGYVLAWLMTLQLSRSFSVPWLATRRRDQ